MDLSRHRTESGGFETRPYRPLLRTLAGSSLALLLPFWPIVAAAAPASQLDIKFSKFNRTYTNLVSELAPIQQGPLTLRLSSPTHSLTVKDTRLRLVPSGNGYAAHLEIDLSGKGWLVGDVDAAGMATRLQDELVVLPQTVALDAKIRMQRAPSGYEVVATELPKQIEVVIQSRLTSEILNWCEGLALFSGFDCDGVERALRTVAIPLPATAGETYFLGDADLTATERLLLDRFLPSPPPPLPTPPPPTGGQ